MADTSDEERNETGEPGRTKTNVVGIGASAGGVRALQQLFAALPEKTGAAFVVVVHLLPDLRSEMSNILAARTHMPVLQVGEPVPLKRIMFMSSRPTGGCTSATTKSPPRNSRSRAGSGRRSTCSSAPWRTSTATVAPSS